MAGGNSVATVRRRDKALLSFILLMLAVTTLAQSPKAADIVIQGIVLSNKTPLPGTTILAVNNETQATFATSKDPSGQYSWKIAATGKYRVSAEIAAFATQTKDVEVTDATKPSRIDFELTLLS